MSIPTQVNGNQADYSFSRDGDTLIITRKADGEVVTESADNFKVEFSDGSIIDLSQSFDNLAASSNNLYFGAPSSTALFVKGVNGSSDVDAGHVLVWEYFSPHGEEGITLQHYDASGKLLKETPLVSGEAEDPTVTATSDGGYIVAWSTESGSKSFIHTQQFGADGTAKDKLPPVADSKVAELEDATITVLPNGNYVISWVSSVEEQVDTQDPILDMNDGQMDGKYESETGDLHLQLYNSSGTKVGTAQKVNTSTVTNSVPDDQVILPLDGGGFLIAYTHEKIITPTWIEDESPEGGYFSDVAYRSELYVREFNANGTPKDTKPQLINSIKADYPNASYQSIVKTQDGYLANWVDTADGINSFGRTLIAQKFDNEFKPVGTTKVVIPVSQPNANDASLTLLENGKYLAVWSTYNGGEANATYAKLLDTDLDPIGEQFIVSDTSTSSYEAMVTPLKDGGFIITWTSGFSGTGSDLFSQRFDKDGKPVGGITTLTGDDGANTIIWNDDETAILKGGAGDDTLQGGSGSDILDGGSGDDTAVFADQDAEYNFSLNTNGSLQVTGKDASDTLYDIEKVQFDNGTISVDDGSVVLESNSFLDSETPSTTTLANGSQVVAWKQGGELMIQLYRDGAWSDAQQAGIAYGRGSLGVSAQGDGFIVTWGEYEGSTLNAQRFNADGSKNGDKIQLPKQNSGWNVDDISATELKDGGLVFAWTEETPDLWVQDEFGLGGEYVEGTGQAYIQLILADGVATSPIALAGDKLQAFEPSVSALQNGGFVVVWEYVNNTGNNESEEIYLQRFKADGSPDGKPIQVNTGLKGDQGDPEVVTLTDGSYVVTWTRETDNDKIINGERVEITDAINIFMQRYSADGKKLGNEAQVNATNGFYNDPSITALKGGGYVISWATSDELDIYSGASTLYAQIFDKNGAKVGSELLVATSSNQDYFPSISASDDGGFLVAWESAERFNGSQGDIHAKHFDANGNSTSLNGDENANTINWTGPAGANLSGGAGDDTLNGGDGSDALNGGDGNDTLNGGAGADYMAGGAGNDTYVIDNAKDQIVENKDEGIDTVESSITWTLGENLENLTLTGDKAINGTGNAGKNIITGNAGNNILNGGAGDDELYGGAGNDTLNGGDGNDTLNGGAGVDKLVGSKGDDTYEVDLIVKGKSKSATLALQDTVTEKAGEGDDTLRLYTNAETLALMTEASKTSTVTLAATLEHLDASATGVIALNLIGHKNAKSLTGNAGANILDAKGGAAQLTGLAGNDTYVIYNESDLARVTEEQDEGNDTLQIAFKSTAAKGERTTIDLGLAAKVENINVTGAGLFDLLGTKDDNRLSGNNSGTRMEGGLGDDKYVLNHKNDEVIENDGVLGGDDTIETAKFNIDLANYANVENVTLTGKAALKATGNDQANLLIGNDGNNILDGGLNTIGFDTLRGGKGNDTYLLNNQDDWVEELTSEGIDTVKAAFDYSLTDNVENLILTGEDNINGTGNELNNSITGNTGDNKLDGGKGVDKLTGGKGNDEYTVDLIVKGKGKTASLTLEDTITEKAKEGDDTLKLRISEEELAQVKEALKDAAKISTVTLAATLENLDASKAGDIALNLTGNVGNNIIVGNAGDNIIIGGAGADTMAGGAGADTFKFTSLKDLGLDKKQDVILDFKSGEDTLDFSVLKGYALVDQSSFGNTAKQLHWEALKDDDGNDYVMIYGNTDKDTDPEFSIKLLGISELTKNDFIGLI